MADDIDIEEHDVLQSCYPDLSIVKTELITVDDDDCNYEDQEAVSSAPSTSEEVPDSTTDIDVYKPYTADEDYTNSTEVFNNCIIVGRKVVNDYGNDDDNANDDDNSDDSSGDEVGFDPETDVKVFNSYVDLQDWGEYLSNSESYCSECSILFPTVNALDFHKMQSHSFLVAVKKEADVSVNVNNDFEEAKFDCKYCDAKLASKNGLTKHLALMHTGRDVAKIVVKQTASGKSETGDTNMCFVCQKQLPSKDALIQHIYCDHLSSFCCTICSKMFAKKEQYEAHLTTHEINQITENDTIREEVYKCSCTAQFKSYHYLKVHLTEFHKEANPPNESELVKSNFVRHCPFCPHSGLNTLKYYNFHILKQHRENAKARYFRNRVYSCTVCGEQFNNYDRARKHRDKIHPDYKTYHILKRKLEMNDVDIKSKIAKYENVESRSLISEASTSAVPAKSQQDLCDTYEVFKCFICSHQSVNQVDRDTHFQTHSIINPSIIEKHCLAKSQFVQKCKFCPELSDTPFKYNRHIRRSHSAIAKLTLGLCGKLSDKALRCTACDEVFYASAPASYHGFKVHKTMKRGEVFIEEYIKQHKKPMVGPKSKCNNIAASIKFESVDEGFIKEIKKPMVGPKSKCKKTETEVKLEKDNDTESERDIDDDLKDNVYRCHCTRQYTRIKRYIKHLEEAHSKIVNKDTGKLVKTKFQTQCTFCEATFRSNTLFNKHLTKKHEVLSLKEYEKNSQEYKVPEKKKIQYVSKLNVQILGRVEPKKEGKTVITKAKRIFALASEIRGGKMKMHRFLQTSALFACNKCDIHFTKWSVASDHFLSKCNTKTNSQMKTYDCVRCNRKISFSEKYTHASQHELNDEDLIVYDTAIEDLHIKILCQCPKCFVHFKEKDIVKHYNHCDSKPYNNYACITCNIRLDDSLKKIHFFSHRDMGFEKDDFIILKYKSNYSSSFVKDHFSKYYYCDNCKGHAFLGNRERKFHGSGECIKIRKLGSNRTCRMCLLRLTEKPLKKHQLLHTKFNMNLKDFVFYSLKTNKRIVTPMHRPLPQCKKCGMYCFGRTLMFHKKYCRTNRVKVNESKICNICNKKYHNEVYDIHMMYHDIGNASEPQFEHKKMSASQKFEFQGKIIQNEQKNKYTFYQCRLCNVCFHNKLNSYKHIKEKPDCHLRNNQICPKCGYAFHGFFSAHLARHETNPNMRPENIRIVKFGGAIREFRPESDEEDQYIDILHSNDGNNPDKTPHNISVVKVNETLKPKTDKANQYTLYKCNVCGVHKEKRRHLCTDDVKLKTCNVCNYDFEAIDFDAHVKKHDSCGDFTSDNIVVIAFDTPSAKRMVAMKRRHDGTKILNEPIKIFKCRCGLHFLNETSGLNHLDRCNIELARLGLNCSKCNIKFDPDQLFRHSLKHHLDDTEVKYIIIKIDPKRRQNTLYKCVSCSTHFVDLSKLKNHIEICTPDKGVNCGECKLEIHESSMDEHMEYHEITSGVDNAVNFHIVDIKASELEQKFEADEPKTSPKAKDNVLYRCVKCDVHFCSFSGLQYHLDVKHKTCYLPKECPTCNLKFFPHTYKRHVEGHHVLNNFTLSDLIIHDSNNIPLKTYSAPPSNAMRNNITDSNLTESIDNTLKASANNTNDNETVCKSVDKENTHTNEVLDGDKIGNGQTCINTELDKNENTGKELVMFYKCDSCEIHFFSRCNLRIHIQLNHKLSSEIKKCQSCSLKFMPASLKAHIRKHHSMPDFNIDDVNIFSSNEVFTEEELNYESVVDDDNTKDHNYVTEINPNNIIQEKTGVVHKCDKCNIHYMSARALVLHLNNKHRTVLDAVECEICKLKFPPYSLVTHTQLHHNQLKLTLDDITILGPGEKEEQEVHELNNVVYRCTICQVCFLYESRCKKHCSSHYTIKGIVSCRICRLVFSTMTHAQHWKEHHEINDFKSGDMNVIDIYKDNKNRWVCVQANRECTDDLENLVPVDGRVLISVDQADVESTHDLRDTVTINDEALRESTDYLGDLVPTSNETENENADDLGDSVLINDEVIVKNTNDFSDEVPKSDRADVESTYIVKDSVLNKNPDKIDSTIDLGDVVLNNELAKTESTNNDLTVTASDGNLPVKQSTHDSIDSVPITDQVKREITAHMNDLVPISHQAVTEVKVERPDDLYDSTIITSNTVRRSNDGLEDQAKSTDDMAHSVPSEDEQKINGTDDSSKAKIKFYKCKECNVNFMEQNHCYEHTMNHTPLSAYDYLECKVCTLNFCVDSLPSHMAQHKNLEFDLKDASVEEYEPVNGTNKTSLSDCTGDIAKSSEDKLT